MNSTAILRASAACLSLAMAGGLLLTAPAVRAQQVGAPIASTPGDETPRDQATENARRDLRHWQARMQDFGNRAHDETDQLNAQARDDLNRAWADVKLNWQKLQNASDSHWPTAHATFDRGVTRLKDTWNRATKQG